MSEQNILNPTQLSAMNPDYGYTEGLPEMRAIFQARGGRAYTRQLLSRGRSYKFIWQLRQQSEADQLRQWAEQYRDDYFTYQDYERSRYFTGRFAGPLQFTPAGYNQYRIDGEFVELPGVPLYGYPTNWSRDAIFIEEADSYGNVLVKLTGTEWDRHVMNYILESSAFNVSPWSATESGGGTAPTLTAGQSDPFGGTNAVQIAFPSTGSGQYSILQQLSIAVPVVAGHTFTYSIWLKVASGTATVSLSLAQATGSTISYAPQTVTTTWTRFVITGTAPVNPSSDTAVAVKIYNPPNSGAQTVIAYGAQVEYGSAASTYTATAGTAQPLISPLPHALEHGGFGYWHPGNNAIDMAEWQYYGYGFQLYAPTNVDMGILALSCTRLDGTVELASTNVDLYSAATVASAAVYSAPNLQLGFHRVKVMPTTTKNASSTGTTIIADALQVMR